MKTHTENHQAGFTLIEFIVGLVVAAIMAAMVYTYFGNALTKSSEPIFRLQKASKLHHVMENIVADFNRLNALNLRYVWQPSTNYRVGAVVTGTGATLTYYGYYYKSSNAGISGASVPTWGATVTDGTSPTTITWTQSSIIVWQPSFPYSVGAIVVPINNNGHYYICTNVTGLGNSGASPGPSAAQWLPTPVPSAPWTVPDNQVTWTEAGTILDSSAVTDNLKHYLDTHPDRYGDVTLYTVVAAETKFIQFDGTNTQVNPGAGTPSTSSEKNILKVTIKSNDSSETLTELFTIR
jgi:prepilin-type N-terminal cleavage/methylation domain-containing protein